MPSFEYVARNSQGTLIRGQVEAEDAPQARARLRQQGLFITSLQARVARRQGPGRDRAQVAAFTRHLEMLVSAGMPLFQALETLAEQLQDKRMRSVMIQIARDIEEGKALSAALARRPDLFTSIYVGVIHHGEMTGRLDQALSRLAGHLERDLEFRGKVRDALIYPALVLTFAVVVLGAFLTYIIPAFEGVYRSAGANLPVLTRGIIAWSKLFRANLPLVGLVIGVLLLPPTRRFLWSRAAGPLQSFLLRIPRAGDLAQTILLSRFAQTMGAMLQSGVPVTAALDVAGEAVGASEYRPAIEALKTEVSQGQRMSDAMRRARWFTPMVIRMVVLGEESGRLDSTLERAGTILEQEFDLRMRRLLTLLEPAVILMLGGIIGVILMALYLPIFSLSKAIVR